MKSVWSKRWTLSHKPAYNFSYIFIKDTIAPFGIHKRDKTMHPMHSLRIWLSTLPPKQLFSKSKDPQESRMAYRILFLQFTCHDGERHIIRCFLWMTSLVLTYTGPKTLNDLNLGVISAFRIILKFVITLERSSNKPLKNMIYKMNLCPKPPNQRL